MTTKLIPYYRVSTTKQGKSGLGMDAQKTTVEAYAQQIKAKVVLPPFVEVESGKNAKRPQLALAIERAKLLRATLVVAKLDRLARNVKFLSTLIDSGVDVHFCDIPDGNRFTIHILAAVAEKEAKDISTRTKAALAAYKARGGKLGRNNLTAEGRKAGTVQSNANQSASASAYRAMLLPKMKELRSSGKTLQKIAEALNADGLTTRRGNPFTHVQVKLFLDAE